jgi:hypothetical protein
VVAAQGGQVGGPGFLTEGVGAVDRDLAVADLEAPCEAEQGEGLEGAADAGEEAVGRIAGRSSRWGASKRTGEKP